MPQLHSLQECRTDLVAETFGDISQSPELLLSRFHGATEFKAAD